MKQRATAFAPASIGNVGVGFDLLGLAISGVGDNVTATRREEAGVVISAVKAHGVAAGVEQTLSAVADKNTSSIAAAALWREHGNDGGLEIALDKGIPLGSGMGSSAASAVAAVVATNALLDKPLTNRELLEYAMQGEAFASRARHADNVAPSLFGGLILCPTDLLPDVFPLPIPLGLKSVLVHPHLRVNTADARRSLSTDVALSTSVRQSGMLAGFVDACHRNDHDLIRRCLADVLVEPQRAPLVSGFATVKAAAIDAGAYGCSLSGSGPSLFAIVPEGEASAVEGAMTAAFAAAGVGSESWISDLDSAGATVIGE